MISIVTVSFNQGHFIRKNIESVLAQNYPNFEHIIIDGGSTDDTVEILRSYPHLKWTSEKDRGQSDGLNKGFSKASGEIIGWLNSDDWYESNIFFDVARAMENCSILLGDGEETDKDGNRREVVENIERTFWDVLKYWVPYAWLAQPPIFFRKSLLEEVKRADGTYLDESLFFCMDFDLWVRMAAQTEFTHRLDKVLAHYRIYDENKTGKYPLATQKECGRVFRRYVHQLSNAEHKYSFVIPAKSLSPEISKTLTSIAAQRFKDFEILFVDYSGSKEFNKQLMEFTLDLSTIFGHNSVRFVKSEKHDLLSALNTGIKASCGLLIATLQEGDVIEPDFLIEASDLFLPDCQGLALPLAWKPELKAMLYQQMPQQLEIKIDNIFRMPYVFPNFIARKATLLELDGLQYVDMPPLALRQLLARTVHKSWAISINNTLSLSPVKQSYPEEDEMLDVFNIFINARICSLLAKDLKEDPFAQVRLKNNTTFGIPDLIQARIEQVLSLAPPGWESLSFLADGATLQQTCKQYPTFSPAWYFLARAFHEQKDEESAREARRRYEETRKAHGEWA